MPEVLYSEVGENGELCTEAGYLIGVSFLISKKYSDADVLIVNERGKGLECTGADWGYCTKEAVLGMSKMCSEYLDC